ncbi:unnamed protein product [Paramecium octaurelia]|uniref:EF-hand domain-containing protein n=1 Tax=Paramecium octaurelia TaxID=43137 RepID=A0A8S1UT11_PAROT|nr:unnamed protein product [Paramecium octaurelia]
MKNKNKQSELNSLFRYIPTATQEQDTRRNSYSYPSNNTVIQQIFNFYTKQSYSIGVNATFDRQAQESNQLNLAKFFHFCRDFNIKFLNKQELQDLFKKCATQGSNITLEQFEQVFSLLAFYRGIDLCQFYQELGFDVWLKNQKKMKSLGKPFQMKDDKQRFTKDQLHYQFKLYHPDIKDNTLIKEILRQRKLKQEKQKNEEKEKKLKKKLQFELKFQNGTELYEKYPQNIQLIKQLEKRKVIKHIDYCKPSIKQAYSLNIQTESTQPKQSSFITWETLDGVAPDSDLIQSLIGPDQDDYCYRNKHEIENNQQKNQRPQLPYHIISLSQDVRSMSASNPNYQTNFNTIQTERQKPQRYQFYESSKIPSSQLNYIQESPNTIQLSNIQNQIEKSHYKTKFNISILKRANEIQQLQDLKEQYLLKKIVNTQLRKEQFNKQNVTNI